MRSTPAHWLAALAIPAILAPGACAPVNNARLSVGGAVLPAIDGSQPVNEPLIEATGPSLGRIDRADWNERAYLVMQDGTRHHPRLTTGGPRYTDAIPRQRGEYPTAMSALDLSADHGAQFWEAVAAPFWAATDVVLFIPRAILNGGPGAVVASPDRVYERAQSTGMPPLDAAVAPID